MAGRDVFGLLLITALVTAMIFTGVTYRIGGARDLWLGSIGILPFATGVATLAMLLIGAAHARSVMEHSQSAERASRFQKAADLMAESAASSRIAGITLVEGIAKEDSTYFPATVLMLQAAIKEADWDIKENIPFFDIAKSPSQTGEDSGERKRQSRGVSFALSALSRLNPYPEAWPHSDTGKYGVLRIQDGYFVNAVRKGSNFAGLKFNRCLVRANRYEECDLRSTYMGFKVERTLTFKNCNLEGAKLVLLDDNRARLQKPLGLRLYFSGSNMKNFTINGEPYDVWAGKHPRIVRISDLTSREEADADS